MQYPLEQHFCPMLKSVIDLHLRISVNYSAYLILSFYLSHRKDRVCFASQLHLTLNMGYGSRTALSLRAIRYIVTHFVESRSKEVCMLYYTLRVKLDDETPLSRLLISRTFVKRPSCSWVPAGTRSISIV
ncbi:hypothetical protein P5V15_000217 [Pogonomyrmex californicus]